jgi:penicillin-binding protein A
MIQSTPVTGGRGYSQRPPSGRRKRLLRHLVPVVLVAAVAFIGGVVYGSLHRPEEQRAADDYAQAYAKRDYDAMYALLTDAAKRRTSADRFRAAHEDAHAIATTLRIAADDAEEPEGGVVPMGMRVQTRVFGPVDAELRLPMEGSRVAWEPHLAFPGVGEGETLDRTIVMPERADLRDATGDPLDPGTRASIGGETGPIPEERADEMTAMGVADDAQVGLTGLERALDDELRGKPGGRLRAGTRVLAASRPRAAGPVRTTIVPRVQTAAQTALAGRLGGVIAMRVGGRADGDIIAAAGIGLSGLQPPGSTFKIITLAGALQARITRPGEEFPVATSALLSGVELQNANGESCGGDLVESFAHSCNSVFGPLGAEMGAEKLVAMAERFGFNETPAIDGAAESTIPPANEIGDDLAVGASAIGQGRVQSNTLQMAIAAATIADRGERPRPTLLAKDRPQSTRAIPPRIARIVARGMRAVVAYGTGVAAKIDGVVVAGKTGTAELVQTQGLPEGEEQVEGETVDTTAWFAAYAPAKNPRVAVAVMLVEAGAGGAVAAPAARTVLAEALRR